MRHVSEMFRARKATRENVWIWDYFLNKNIKVTKYVPERKPESNLKKLIAKAC